MFAGTVRFDCERDKRPLSAQRDGFLNIKCPFTLTHDGFACAIFFDSVNIHLGRTDHKVCMIQADVSSNSHKLFIVQLFASGD